MKINLVRRYFIVNNLVFSDAHGNEFTHTAIDKYYGRKWI